MSELIGINSNLVKALQPFTTHKNKLFPENQAEALTYIRIKRSKKHERFSIIMALNGKVALRLLSPDVYWYNDDVQEVFLLADPSAVKYGALRVRPDTEGLGYFGKPKAGASIVHEEDPFVRLRADMGKLPKYDTMFPTIPKIMKKRPGTHPNDAFSAHTIRLCGSVLTETGLGSTISLSPIKFYHENYGPKEAGPEIRQTDITYVINESGFFTCMFVPLKPDQAKFIVPYEYEGDE